MTNLTVYCYADGSELLKFEEQSGETLTLKRIRDNIEEVFYSTMRSHFDVYMNGQSLSEIKFRDMTLSDLEQVKEAFKIMSAKFSKDLDGLELFKDSSNSVNHCVILNRKANLQGTIMNLPNALVCLLKVVDINQFDDLVSSGRLEIHKSMSAEVVKGELYQIGLTVVIKFQDIYRYLQERDGAMSIIDSSLSSIPGL